MNIKQAARYKAYALSLAHLKENEALTKDVPAFAEALEAAKATLDLVTAAENLRLEDRAAITIGKRKFRDEMAHEAQLVADAMVSFAAKQEDPVLEKAMNFTRTDLFHSGDVELAGYASNILSMAKQLNGELKKFGISDELMSSFASKVEQYQVAAGKPRSTQAERVEAGQQLTDGLNKLRAQFKNQLDRLMRQYKFSHPEFYNQYRQKRQVVNSASRKTGLEGIITGLNGNSGLAGAEVLVSGTSLKTTTANDGSYLLLVPLTGEVEITFRMEGYEPQTLKVGMKRGQRTRADLVLKPLVV